MMSSHVDHVDPSTSGQSMSWFYKISRVFRCKRRIEVYEANEEPAQPAQVNEIHEERAHHANFAKIVLAGPEFSGKSTVFKNMKKILLAEQYEEEIREQFTVLVHANAAQALLQLINAGYKLDFEAENDDIKSAIDTFSKGSEGQKTIDLRKDKLMRQSITEIMSSQFMESVLKQREKIQLLEGGLEFLKDFDRIMETDYTPTNIDIIMARESTEETAEFLVDNKLKVVDVGGQREGGKWLKHFRDAAIILFVVDVSTYYIEVPIDPENQGKNLLTEFMKVFKETMITTKFDEGTRFFLLLNKCDIFMEKIKNKPLTECFPSYTGSQDPDESVQHVANVFRRLMPDGKVLNVLFVTAIEEDSVSCIFSPMKIVLQSDR